MGKQKAFFLSNWEIFQKEHPEKFERKPSSGGKRSSKKIYDCSTCGLHRKCRSPKMERFGNGKKRILIIGQNPGRVEDREGIPMVGPSGRLANRMFGYVGIDMDEDCERTNIVQCYPGQNSKGADKDPTKDQIKCCRERILRDIEEVKPKLIICFGTPAINAVLKDQYTIGFTANQMHGKVVPCHKHNCWVGCSYHPAFFRYRKRKKDKFPDDEIILGYDLANIISYLDQPLPQPLSTEGNKCITNVEEVIKAIEDLCISYKPTAYDYETTNLYPWIEGAELLSISASNDINSGIFIPLKLKYDNGDMIFSLQQQELILDAWRKFLRSDIPKVVQNINMEEIWNRMYLNQSASNIIHDTMIAAHVINNSSNTTSLGFQTFILTGHSYKGMVDVKKLLSEPLEKVCNYNCWDSRYTLMSYYDQKKTFSIEKRLGEFYKFYHEGAKVLVSLRERGNRIDMDILQELDDKYLAERELRIEEMRSLRGVKQYEEESGNTFNPESATRQLQKILYGIYGVEKTRELTTPSGLGCTDKNAIQIILGKTKNDDVRKLLAGLTRFRKTCSITERITNYKNVMDSKSYVHPSYNLNMADTYRSSSCDPNIQNVFQHDKELRIFRKCIVPTRGRIILEVDHSGMEVKGIAMASGDPELIRQIKEGVKWTKEHPEGGHNPYDTHYRWSTKVYSKSVDDVTKDERYIIKNQFVFPSFYGSIAKSVARNFPNIPADHVIQVQKEFWEEYHYVREWQNRVLHDYLKNGYAEALNGWRRIGPLSINQLFNNLIQGTSFHLLLGALIMIELEFPRRKLKTVADAEIHDSIKFDAVLKELSEVIDVASEILCSKQYNWQKGIPLGVEWEIGYNWHDMHSIIINNQEKFVVVDKERIKLEDLVLTI